MQCEVKHDKTHKLISHKDMIPKIEEIKNKMEEVKNIIDKFNKNIDEIILLFQIIKNKNEKYYTINNDILNNFDINNRNYESLKNISVVNNINNNEVVNSIKDVINDNDINENIIKIIKLNKLNDQINNNEINNNEINMDKNDEMEKYKDKINLIYKTAEKNNYIIFGKNFVENNGDNIELNIKGIKSKLIDKYDLEEENNNIKLIIKNKLKNLEEMFKDCKTLSNIQELKF